MTTNIFISAGDKSGDKHAANLIRSIKSISKDTYVSALGGQGLKEVADNLVEDIVSLSAFGFFPLKQFIKLKKVFNDTVKYWETRKPDKVILVDYYGFNIHLAEEAFKMNIPVYYYISPQVWASRPQRVKKLARFVKKIFVILPFEEKIYKDAGVAVEFVGHPLIDFVPVSHGESSKDASGNKPIIGFFPGSRQHIVDRHLILLKKVKDIISSKMKADFKVFGLKELDYSSTDMPVVYEDTFDDRKKLSIAITVSGTVSLENALLGVPMIVFYKLSWLNYIIAKLITNIKYITMVNILENKEIVPEFIQDKASAENIAGAAIELINDKEKLVDMKNKLLSFRSRLGEPYVSLRTAKTIMSDKL